MNRGSGDDSPPAPSLVRVVRVVRALRVERVVQEVQEVQAVQKVQKVPMVKVVPMLRKAPWVTSGCGARLHEDHEIGIAADRAFGLSIAREVGFPGKAGESI